MVWYLMLVWCMSGTGDVPQQCTTVMVPERYNSEALCKEAGDWNVENKDFWSYRCIRDR